MKRRVFSWSIGGALVLAAIFLLSAPRMDRVTPEFTEISESSSTPEAAQAAEKIVQEVPQKPLDIPPQPQLAEPPTIAKGIYLTSWSAGSASKMKRTIELIERTELNAVVIDIKDYSGFVAYETGIPIVKDVGAENDIRIVYPNKLIKELHDKNVYIIGRISVFQDPIFAKSRPELALRNASSGEVWQDQKGLAWLDPSAQETWDYNVAIAQDAFNRGFDEINFDYIRFASDGDLARITFPKWKGHEPKSAVIKRFFAYLRDSLPGEKISADLFGLTTVDKTDLGIGQIIEHAYGQFDFVSPMTYPSHYAPGFIGFMNPAVYPYEVVRYSMEHALVRLHEFINPPVAPSAATSAAPSAPRDLSVKLRPWLQDFDLGATYTADMVRDQIRAVEETLFSTSTNSRFGGWLLWDPANTYTEGALRP